MARVLKFKQGDSGTELNLLAGSGAGWNVKSWFPSVNPIHGAGPMAPVQEEMICLVEGASDDDLASDLQAMHDMRRFAVYYQGDDNFTVPVWLHFNTDGESNSLRALVLNSEEHPFEVEYVSQPSSQTGEIDQDKAKVRIRFWRLAWEAPSSTAGAADSPSAGIVYVYDYCNGTDVEGDTYGRMELLRMRPAAGDEIGRLWMGFRSDAFIDGDADNLVPVWECEDGTLNASESGIAVDNSSDVNGASPGGGSGEYVEVVETDLEWDDTWHEVVSIAMADVITTVAHLPDNFGTFLTLLRSKVTAGTWEVKLKLGYDGFDDADLVELERIVEVDNTSWDLAEAGIVSIPIRQLHMVPLTVFGYAWEQKLCIKVFARRTSGSGDLYVDCIGLCPIDEGYLFAWGFDMSRHVSGGPTDEFTVGHSPEGRLQVLTNSYDSTEPLDDKYMMEEIPPFEHQRWGPPPGDGRLVIFHARASSSDFTDNIDLLTGASSTYFFARWASLRGNA